MRTIQLEYIIDLYQTKSITKTAEKFFTTHQSVNNAIKQLEKELDIQILNRTHKGVSLTEAGTIIYHFAIDVLNRKNKLQNDLHPYLLSNQENLNGELAIYIIPRFANKHFYKFYSSFCHRYQTLTTSIKTISSSLFFQLLPLPTPSIFLTTARKSTLDSKVFLSLLSEYDLSYKIISKHTIGICCQKNSKWKTAIQTFFSTSKFDDLPVTTFNYTLDETHLFLVHCPPSNLALVDDFDIQKQMVLADSHVCLCAKSEYDQFFYSKNSSLQFMSPPSISEEHLALYYIALFPLRFLDDPICDHFLSAFSRNY